MKFLYSIFKDDPFGYKLHRFMGWVLLFALFVFQLVFGQKINFTVWGSVVIGLFALYLVANLWELLRKLLYGIKPSSKDVLWTMRGGFEISFFRLVIYLLFKV